MKLHDSCGEISSKEVSAEEEDHESGSEETVIEQASSQVTMDTIKTGSSNNTGSWKTADTVSSSGKTNLRIDSPRASPSHTTTTSSSNQNTVSSPILTNRSQSTGNIETPSNLKMSSGLSPSAPMIIEESSHTDPLSVKNKTHDPSRRHTDSFRFSKSENNNELKVPQFTSIGGGSPGGPGMTRHVSKGGASVQTSQVTAVPGGVSSKYRHHRQSSMGVYHQHPSPLTYGHHKRHNSIRLVHAQIVSNLSSVVYYSCVYNVF